MILALKNLLAPSCFGEMSNLLNKLISVSCQVHFGITSETSQFLTSNQISAEDFAIATVDELENHQHVRERFTVASVDEIKREPLSTN